jgi:chitinase
MLQQKPWFFQLLTLVLSFQIFTAHADLWRTGYYYPGYGNTMPVNEIDFTALTQVVHFSLVPQGDGTVDTVPNNLTPQIVSNLVQTAHAAGKKVLVCVGGGGTYFPNAASFNNVNIFVGSLTNFMATNNYDGIDVDWEPVNDSDAGVYTNFIKKLRVAMNAFPAHKVLATAIMPSTTTSLIASIQTNFDQINLMTYDYSGAYDGWVTWYNSPLYDGGYTFPSNPSELVPSTEASVTNFLAAGIPASRLGIGVAFYGDVWTGGSDGSGNSMTNPREGWSSAPTNYTVTYNQIISSNFAAGDFNYDAVAQAPWIGVGGRGLNNLFVSYDNPRSVQARISYARNRALGGVIIWELTQDHISGRPDPLLQAVKQAVATPGNTAIQRSGTNVNLSFNSAPLGSYSVLWATNPAAAWSTLQLTNLGLTQTGGVIRVSDYVSQRARFYRVRTPP